MIRILLTAVIGAFAFLVLGAPTIVNSRPAAAVQKSHPTASPKVTSTKLQTVPNPTIVNSSLPTVPNPTIVNSSVPTTKK